MKRPILKSALSESMYLFLDREERTHSSGSLRAYYNSLKSFDSYLCEINYCDKEISMTTLTTWIEQLGEKSKGTRKHYQSALYSFLDFAQELGIKSTRPDLIRTDSDYAPHIYTDGERNNLHMIADSFTVQKSCQLPYIRVEIPMAMRILDSCGTRVTETLSIQMKDVDLYKGIITMRYAKGNKERIVPMDESLTEIIEKYCMAMGIMGRPEAYLFPKKDMTAHLNDRDFRNYFLRILKRAKVEIPRDRKYQRSVCAHDLRHSFSCRSLNAMISSGMDEEDAVPYLSTYIGHKDLYSTERYLQYPTEHFYEEVAIHEHYAKDILNDTPLFQEDITTWRK